MRKVLPFLFTVLLFLAFYKETNASILKVNKDGTATFNVLSYKDSSDSLEIKGTTEGVSGSLAVISLSKTGDAKFNLAVNSGGVSQNLDIENLKGEIVEIEERPQVKKMSIGILEDKFSLKQKEITAITDYPITVNSENAEMKISTNDGDINLLVYPYDAVEMLTKSKLITEVKNNTIEILAEENRLLYKVEGEKIIPILNLYDYKIPVTTHVSATTGEIVSVDTPNWLKFINVFFS